MQHQNLSISKTRLNIQISSELKDKLFRISAMQGKKVSVLVRESIEEKLKQDEKRIFDEKMKSAYLDLAKENIEVSEDFKYVDAEKVL
ncbi:MAG: hypothetical protein KAW56_15050 [Candidatus Marinimicrobia bacterium]|nr:hypothetical protein [Candidatus Neomarinimicrobiota bacterium]